MDLIFRVVMNWFIRPIGLQLTKNTTDVGVTCIGGQNEWPVYLGFD